MKIFVSVDGLRTSLKAKLSVSIFPLIAASRFSILSANCLGVICTRSVVMVPKRYSALAEGKTASTPGGRSIR